MSNEKANNCRAPVLKNMPDQDIYEASPANILQGKLCAFAYTGNILRQNHTVMTTPTVWRMLLRQLLNRNI